MFLISVQVILLSLMIYFCSSLQAGLSFRHIGKESPDSTEQCTGEEPAPDLSGRESATENNLPTCRERVKT